ncbi:MAG: hypothetical protein HYW89_04620 [Candidatus Sungiibacteriota bacterium]|uniref:Uncharacterized protein n=1 Tax=Candidatus Sungiibacteriota bacterium TaxID=2750080 RepID=A0A7T5UQL9_9BACT|nr:MAG: hypothetical protein HYW89_04620 [Candidatus Sungbacteria bacterium]
MTTEYLAQLVALYPEPFVFAAIGIGIFLADVVFEVAISPILALFTKTH